MKHFDKKYKHKVNIFISLAIIVSFSIVLVINSLTYNEIIKEDIKNISKLSSSNIYSEINNELIKPIFVSLTMANDSFLKEWLENEESHEMEEDLLIEYLAGLRTKYNYNSVFVISETSKNYYHYKGLHKTIESSNEHDQWYFNFTSSEKVYDLDVDIDEASDRELTVFVNCRIENSEGELIGVVGVGLEMNEIQDILEAFDTNYDLEAYLIDSDGTVQVHADSEMIEVYNVKEEQGINGFMDEILSHKTSFDTYEFDNNGKNGYLITKYIEDLEWTLMVKKDTSVLKRTFYHQIGKNLIIVSVVIIVLIWLSNNAIKKFSEEMSKLAQTDETTGLLNRRGFNKLLEEALKNKDINHKEFSAFIFDIDCFKKINDQYGHLFGDEVLALLAEVSEGCIANQGIISRWGGDEFAGIIYGDIESSVMLLKDIQNKIKSHKKYNKYSIGISIGITYSQVGDTLDIITGRADKGLYKSKDDGRGCISIE